jgi:hypothetical protein
MASVKNTKVISAVKDAGEKQGIFNTVGGNVN